MNSLPGDHDFRFGIRSSPPINGLPIRNGNLMYNSSYPTYYENSGVVSDLYPLPSNSGSENDEFGNFKYYGNSLLQDDLLHNRVRRHQSLPGESFTQDLGHYPMNEDIAHLQKGIGFRPPVCKCLVFIAQNLQSSIFSHGKIVLMQFPLSNLDETNVIWSNGKICGANQEKQTNIRNRNRGWHQCARSATTTNY